MPDHENENPDAQPQGEPAPAAEIPPVPAGMTSDLPAAPPLTDGATHLSESAEKANNGGSRRLVRRFVGIGVAIAIGLGITYMSGKNESDNAPAVGECAKPAGDNKIKKVGCDDSAAEFEVVSRVDGTTDGETACASNPTATSYYAYEAENTGVEMVSFVLCMADR